MPVRDDLFWLMRNLEPSDVISQADCQVIELSGGVGHRFHGVVVAVDHLRDGFDASSNVLAGDGLLSAGIEQSWHRREETQRATGASLYSGDYDARARQWTGWLQHEWPLAKALTLTYGLRGEHVVLEAQGRQQSASQLAPSLAGRFEFAPDLILRSSLGAGLKAPKLEEISGLTVRGAGYRFSSAD